MIQHKGRILGVVVLILSLFAAVGLGHTHHGNSNETVVPSVIDPGGSVTVGFNYAIWHSHDGYFLPIPQACPWEIRLDGTTGVRNGTLLAAGSFDHPANNVTLTFSVSQSVTIPAATTAGSHTIKIVTAVAPWVNLRYSYLTITVNDTIPPTVAFTSVPPDPDNDATPSFGWMGADNYSAPGNLEYSTQLDGGGWSAWAAATSTTMGPLAEGLHTFEVKAKDEAGNVSTPDSYTWFVDLTAPTTVFTTTPPDPDNNPNPFFAWAGTDNYTAAANLVYSTKLDSGGWSLWTSATSTTIGPLAEGWHTYQVRAKDEAGNVESTASYTWFVDLTPPVITLLQPILDEVYMLDELAYASWTVEDEATDVAKVLATARDGKPIPTGWPGPNKFTITAVDLAGNESSVEAEYLVIYTIIPGAGDVAGGGGTTGPLTGFLDRSIAGGGAASGGVPLEAIYMVDQPIIISFDLENVNSEQFQHGMASVSLVQLPAKGSDDDPVILRFEDIHYVVDAGLYTFTLDPVTEGGYYDIWLGFNDGVNIQLRILVAAAG